MLSGNALLDVMMHLLSFVPITIFASQTSVGFLRLGTQRRVYR